MITAACVKSELGKLYAGASHLYARQTACTEEGITMSQTRPFAEGFLSDTNEYHTKSGHCFIGYYRSRAAAFLEASECGQLFTTRARIDGLSSDEISFTAEQIENAHLRAQYINKEIDYETIDMRR